MLSAFPKWALTKCLHRWEAGEGSDIPKETQLLLSSSLLKPCAGGFGWPKARVIDVCTDRSGISGKVKYLLLLWAPSFRALQEAAGANRQWGGYWTQNKPLVFLKAPVKLQVKKNNWVHNSLFGYDTELLEVRFLYHSCTEEYLKSIMKRKSFEIGYLLDFQKWPCPVNEFGWTGPRGSSRAKEQKTMAITQTQSQSCSATEDNISLWGWQSWPVLHL